MEGKREGGFLLTVAETRFSDFSARGTLHFSKCLMYFEKARFAVAEAAGIREALGRALPGAEIAFVVIRVRLNMREPVALRAKEYDRALRVRTRLEPSALCRMTFRQQLEDAADGRILTEGTVDVVILVNGEVLRQFPPEVRECLDTYGKMTA